MPALLDLTIKDWFIVIVLLLLMLCILEIRRLRKSIAREIHKQILPHLILDLISDPKTAEPGFYLKNESFFLAQNLYFESIGLTLNDTGYNIGLVLKFDDIGYIRAKETVKLTFKVFDKNQNFLPDVTERIIPHLRGVPFKVRILFSNIENLKFSTTLVKKGEKFYGESFNVC